MTGRTMARREERNDDGYRGSFHYGGGFYMKQGKLTSVVEAVKEGLVVYTIQTVLFGEDEDGEAHYRYIDAPTFSDHNGKAQTLAQIMTAAGFGYDPVEFRTKDGFLGTGWRFHSLASEIETCALAAGYLEQLDAWDIFDRFACESRRLTTSALSDNGKRG